MLGVMSTARPDFDCFLRIRASFGGPEARHFAGILLRMYTRWAEREGLRHVIGEVGEVEEGAVERATLKVAGAAVLQRLGGEAGVHRMVRIPPGETRRHASFVVVEVTSPDDDADADAASASAASEQVRTYVLHPSESVTDDRAGQRTEDARAVLDGDLTGFVPRGAI